MATSGVRAEIRGLKEVRDKADQIARDLEGPGLVQPMRDATLIVTADARRNAPVDTGRLRASIVPEVVQLVGEVQGVVGSNVLYAPYMELGTGTFVGRPRHYVPIAALEVWARRHHTSARLVARAIAMRGGLAPRYYLKRALENNADRIAQLIGKAVGHIVTKGA